MVFDINNYKLMIVAGIILFMLVVLAKAICNSKSKRRREKVKSTTYYALATKENRKKQNDITSFERMFIKNAGITARTGKSVYIRKGHHEKIMKIVQVIGRNQLSLFSYIDNVLNHHFESFKDEITELYNKNNEGIF